MDDKHIDELRIINARRNGCTIRKISEMYEIPYLKVLGMLHATQVDAEDRETDSYVEETMKKLIKKK